MHRRFINVSYIQHRLGCQQEDISDSLFIFTFQFQSANVLTLLQVTFTSHQYIQYQLLLGISLNHFLYTGYFLFHAGQIGQLQLGIDDFFITHRVDHPLLTQDVFIFEATDHVCDRIYLTDVT
ncbi:hypothetical protein D3C86_1302000 [compost metagenome]